MKINHHPDDALLLDHASGALASGPSLVVACHVEGCPHCQERVGLFQAVGGALLDEIEPVALASSAFDQVMARIEATSTDRTIDAASVELRRPSLPEGAAWPQALEGCKVTDWRWLGPGMRWSRVTLPHDSKANVFLLRIGAGKMLPVHTHSQTELTQILYGTFHDGRALFGQGDFDEADGSIEHQPVVQPGGECICLAAVSGKVLFKSAAARVLGSLVGM